MGIKICHISSVHPPFDVRIFHKEACSLQRAGYDTYMVVSGAESQINKGVQVIGVEDPAKGRWHRMTEHSKYVIEQAKKVQADIYHLHDPELLPYAIELKKMGAKVIYDSHEDLPRQTMSKNYIPKLIRPFVALGLKYYENYIAKNIDAIVSATDSIRDRFNGLNKNIIVVNNFPFIEELKVKTLQATKERAVCYVGSVARMRGAIEIVKAVGLANNVKLFLAGAINEPGLRDDMAKQPGWNNVEELGFVPREEVAKIMAKSLAGLVALYPEPNHLKSIPIKMFEYLSASIPIICSDFPHWRRLLEGVNCAIFVNPLDPYDIANAISWVIEHPEEAKAMGAQGQYIVENRFNWENEEKKLIDLYAKLCNR
ncbi:MAG: glycosyltransferase family 4 protein [Bdellovibrionales bacterium]|nr:glycosyltransferase family 4 protein [Bdellovibrionales bacterium]